VLDGDPTHYPKRGGVPPNFRPTSIVTKRLHGSRWHLVWTTEVGLGLHDTVFDVDQLPAEQGNTHPTQFLTYVYCGQMGRWMKTLLGTEVDLSPGHIVLDGVPLPTPAKGAPPLFSAHVYCGHGRPSQLLLSSRFNMAPRLK